ncbi:hypothetical protein ABS767_10835 [Sphingomonas sp. ST-64]|uniref:Uncharacterized protein n=1 Tax=Sphingomonas plantiphila TaxID=3163295 RepID=A0ABW8YN61_9SPHN
MLAIATLLIWAALLLARGTGTGRTLNVVLVVNPARWLNRFTRGQAIVLGLSALFAGLLFWIMEEEGLRLASMYAPELMALAASVEFTAAVDAIMVGIVTAGSMRLRGVKVWLSLRLSRPAPRAARRTPRVQRPRPPANDADDPARAVARAA